MLLKFWDRLLGKKHLNFSHYRITNNALEALQWMKHDEFDIVITDIVMPELDGFDFIREAWQCNPKMKLIFTTAYECDFKNVVLAYPQVTEKDIHVLLKPYQDISQIEEFVTRICEDDKSLNKPEAISNPEQLQFHVWKL